MGEKCGQRGVEIGGQRPHRNQRVHVGGLLPGRLEGADIKPAAHPEDHRCCEDKKDHQQRLPGNPHEKGEPMLHGPHEDGDRQRHADPKAQPQVFVFPLPRGGDRILDACILNAQILIALVDNDLLECIRTAPQVTVRNRCFCRGEIHGHVAHALHFFQRPLNAPDASGTGHSANGDRCQAIPILLSQLQIPPFQSSL